MSNDSDIDSELKEDVEKALEPVALGEEASELSLAQEVLLKLQAELLKAQEANAAVSAAKDASGQTLDEITKTSEEAKARLEDVKQALNTTIAEVNETAAGTQNVLSAAKEASLAEIKKVDEAAAQALEESKASMDALVNSIREKVVETESALNTTKNSGTVCLDEIAGLKTQAEDVLKQAQEAVQTFHGNVEKYRSDMDRISHDISEHNQNKMTELAEIGIRLLDFETRAKGQLEAVAGANLFGSFDKRKEEIGRTKWRWIALAFFSLFATAGWTWFVVLSSGPMNTVFFVKAAVAVPLGAMLVFCLQQFSRDRHTEEEYAFKGAISLSLSAYQAVIEQLAKKEGLDGAYAKFLVDTIRQIYAPLQTVKEKASQEQGSDSSLDAIRQALDVVVKAKELG